MHCSGDSTDGVACTSWVLGVLGLLGLLPGVACSRPFHVSFTGLQLSSLLGSDGDSCARRAQDSGSSVEITPKDLQ